MCTVVCAGLLTLGCTDSVNGKPAPGEVLPERSTSLAHEYGWLTNALPSDDDLSRAVGYQITTDGEHPPVRGVTDLRNTAAVKGEITEPQCFAVTAPLEVQTYNAASVEATTFVTDGPMTYGAVVLASAADAGSLFAEFVEQWKQCDGKTVMDSDAYGTFTDTIADVEVTGNVLSAVVTVNSTSPTGVPVRDERALGVTENGIVDISLPITDPSPDTPREQNRAIDLANAMLENFRTARR